MSNDKKVKLLGRIIITGNIECKTGLHIGGSAGTLSIGNVDMPVIRNAINGQPYIPGSSLKGKLRSLSEKFSDAPLNKNMATKDHPVMIHVAETIENYKKYWVNPIFGLPGNALPDLDTPNRLIVRDVPLSIDSESKLRGARTDMPYTEVKWEAVIDRVTSAASPRQTERVPAGAVFGPMELVFNAFSKEDANLFGNVLTAMQLLEGDYLGGQGSRGSGQISFITLQVCVYSGENYVKHEDARFSELNLAELIEKKADLIEWVSASLAG